MFGLTGNGTFDIGAYMQYHEGSMDDFAPSDEELEQGFATIPNPPGHQE